MNPRSNPHLPAYRQAYPSRAALPALLTALILLAASCGRSGLAPSDANAPTGWATCESIAGGSYELTGGACCPAKGVRGRKIILRADSTDMKARIEDALRSYDIVVLDGSGGPFRISGTMEFENLRNKSLVGRNGAVLRSAFQCTPPIREAIAGASETYAGARPADDGLFHLSNDSTARSFPAYACYQALLDVTGDLSMGFLRSGFFRFFAGCENLILRNLTFDGPGSFRGLAHPMISVRYGAHNVWIDHCLFEDFARVAVGITKGADCVTVSWCEFRITGQSNGHSLGSLIASGDDNWEDEDLLNVTFDHCLWRNVWSRVPMARFGTIHVLNNWYDCAGTVGINPRQNAEFLVEGCWFEPGTNPLCRYKITETPPKAYVFRDNVHDPQFAVESLGEVSVPYACAVTDPARAKAEVGAFAGPTLRRPMQVGRRRGMLAREKD